MIAIEGYLGQIEYGEYFIIWRLLVLCVILTAYYTMLKPLSILFYLKLKHGDEAYLQFYPILGDQYARSRSYKMYGDGLEYRRRIVERNPKLKFLLTNEFNHVFIIILDPEYYKDTFQMHENFRRINFVSHEDLMERGMLFSIGSLWNQQRRMLAPFFAYEVLQSRVPMINEVAQQSFETLPKDDLRQLMFAIAGEVFVRSFFNSTTLTYQGQPLANAVQEVLLNTVTLRNRNPFVVIKYSLLGQLSWRWPILNREREVVQKIKGIRAFLKSLIEQRIQERKSRGAQATKDFLDVQLDQSTMGQDEMVEEIIQQFITFVSAGTHTTSGTAEMCLYYLSQHPAAQQELLAEVEATIGDREPNGQELNKLPLLTAFIKETQRLKNIIFNPGRRKVMSDCSLKDLRLKKGWFIVQSIDSVGANPRFINNPREFNYKRWVEQQSVYKEDNGFMYIPFGAGPRNCIGQYLAMMELKIILINILRRYNVEPNNDVKVTFPIIFSLTIQPANFARLIPKA